ncbi:MAG: protease modulator HflC [Chromatiales bacterium]|nr:protease modulator HflC [Chromatiales bacterium]
MEPKKLFGLVLLGVALIVVASSVFIVKETELALRLRFGRIVQSDYQPGLHWKWPLIDNVAYFDKRILTLDAPPARILSAEKKDLIVDSYVKFRIADAATFFRATGGGDEGRVARLVFEIVNSGLRDEFGQRTVQEAVSGERLEIMGELTRKADELSDGLGVEIVDVRVKRIDLPGEVSDSVHRRMRAERERVARELRSKGGEEAEKIRADADRRSTVILAEASREAERLRGDGDATATQTYAAAHQKNAEFYSLYRSLTAYQQIFGGSGNNMMVLEPDSDFFRYFDQKRPGRE